VERKLTERLSRLRERVQTLGERHLEQAKMLEPLKKRDKALNHKADILAQMVMETYYPEISQAEKQYFEELDALELKAGDLPLRVNRIKSQLADFPGASQEYSGEFSDNQERDMQTLLGTSYDPSLPDSFQVYRPIFFFSFLSPLSRAEMLAKVADKLQEIQATISPGDIPQDE